MRLGTHLGLELYVWLQRVVSCESKE